MKYQQQRRNRDRLIGEAVAEQIEGLTRQLMVDCVCVALHLVCGFGKDRIRRIMSKAAEIYGTVGKRMFRTRKIKRPNQEPLDSDYEQARSEMDRALAEIFGDSFEDFDSRYGDYI